MRSLAQPKRTSKKTNSLTKLIWAMIVVAVLAVGAAAWYITSRPPTPANHETDIETVDNNQPSKQDITDKTDTPPPPSTDVPPAAGLAVAVTKLEQANGNVTIVGSVTGQGAGDGTCVANFTTPQDRPVVKQAAATVKDGVVTCGPIVIDEVEFSYLGDWQAKLTFYTPQNKSQVSSEPKTIAIK